MDGEVVHGRWLAWQCQWRDPGAGGSMRSDRSSRRALLPTCSKTWTLRLGSRRLSWYAVDMPQMPAPTMATSQVEVVLVLTPRAPFRGEPPVPVPGLTSPISDALRPACMACREGVRDQASEVAAARCMAVGCEDERQLEQFRASACTVVQSSGG